MLPDNVPCFDDRSTMPTAFVLGAGLGTRLRPITDKFPKPLVPVGHEPLITWAFRHLAQDWGANRFVINTHHLPAAYAANFPTATWNGYPLAFRHEPVLLDTGAGLANVRDLLPADESVAIYNGDILCDAPLGALADEHARHAADVTMLLRSGGALRNVVCPLIADESAPAGCPAGPVLDIRGLLGRDGPCYQFAGICLVSPAFLAALPAPDHAYSLIPQIVETIRLGGRVRGVLIDAGHWSDLGTADALLAAHTLLLNSPFPRYAPHTFQRIHPEAQVAPATMDEASWAGPGVVIPAGCVVSRSLVLAGTHLAPGTVLNAEVVC